MSKEKQTAIRGNPADRKRVRQVSIEDLDQTGALSENSRKQLVPSRSITKVTVEDLDETRTFPEVIVEDMDETRTFPEVIVEDMDETRTFSKVIVEDMDETRTFSKVIVEDMDETRTFPKAIVEDMDETRTFPKAIVEDMDETRTFPKAIVEDMDDTQIIPTLRKAKQNSMAAEDSVEIEDLDETRVIPSVCLEHIEPEQEPSPGEIGEALIQAGQEASAAEAVCPGWNPERPEQRMRDLEPEISITPVNSDTEFRDRPPRKPPEPETLENDFPEEEGHGKKRAIFVGIAVAAVLAIALGAFGVYRILENKKMLAYYETHFLPATTINGQDCSGMTAEEVTELFSKEVRDYSLTIRSIDGAEDRILASEIGLVMRFDVDFHGLLASQDKSGWRKAEENPSELTFVSGWEYDAKLLKDRLNASALFQNMTDSKDAEIVYDETAAQFVLNPEVIGTKVDLEQVFRLAQNSVETLQTTLPLEEAGCYSAVKRADDAMAKAVETMNAYLKAQVSYSFGEKKETLTPEKIKEAISYDTAYQVTLDSSVFENWVKELAEKYNTVGKSRSFRSTKSGTVTVSGGNYGWKINQEKTVEQVLAAVQTGGSVTEGPVYTQEGKSHDSNDIGDTYIEVDLTHQVIYYYENGSKKLSSDMVSGRVIRNTKTVKGVYYIYDKERNRTLKGADYSSDVSYWMPFYGGYGLHDATWRSEFGGKQYLTNGSHGCINLPLSKAKSLYNMISEGTPVIVFGGVDSYDAPEEPATTTKAPETTKKPESTTKTSETTTKKPEPTTEEPKPTTEEPTPTTEEPETTTTTEAQTEKPEPTTKEETNSSEDSGEDWKDPEAFRE
ncbi:L,D-transpeptidase family protein [Hominifimenecus sp. rT4P-3]|uniref:L,D-transpeptidase family protein n=1 Tax=Hominifimenecus sp. rT4P-3 TaxID=3242979 RepID=UPI003DA65C6C